VKLDNMVYVEHGKPLVFGKNRDKGLRLNGLDLEVVSLSDGVTEKDLLIHDESARQPTLAGMLSRMTYPEMPECLGVLRCIERPTFDAQLREQSEKAVKAKGRGKLEALFASDDTWTVEAN
jgi:2-oxoglutarate/2-oxoacid ferredoxin oxidoreductase subunit beta